MHVGSCTCDAPIWVNFTAWLAALPLTHHPSPSSVVAGQRKLKLDSQQQDAMVKEAKEDPPAKGARCTANVGVGTREAGGAHKTRGNPRGWECVGVGLGLIAAESGSARDGYGIASGGWRVRCQRYQPLVLRLLSSPQAAIAIASWSLLTATDLLNFRHKLHPCPLCPAWPPTPPPAASSPSPPLPPPRRGVWRRRWRLRGWRARGA